MHPVRDSSHYTAINPWKTDALIDWCEDNFTVGFIAELVNASTNIVPISLGIWGMHLAIKHSYGRRFWSSYLCLALVGTGSALFHATLTYWSQLLDEVPMLFGSSVFIYAALTPMRPSPPTWCMWVLLLVPSIITMAYLVNRNIEFFQFSYALMATVVVFITTWTHFKHVSTTCQDKRLITREHHHAHHLLIKGFGTFMLGMGFWVTDTVLCYSHMIPAKLYLGYPWRLGLEFHGWWHILSGYGCFLVVMSLVVARHNALVLTRQPSCDTITHAQIVWHYWIIPEVVFCHKHS